MNLYFHEKILKMSFIFTQQLSVEYFIMDFLYLYYLWEKNFVIESSNRENK